MVAITDFQKPMRLIEAQNFKIVLKPRFVLQNYQLANWLPFNVKLTFFALLAANMR